MVHSSDSECWYTWVEPPSCRNAQIEESFESDETRCPYHIVVCECVCARSEDLFLVQSVLRRMELLVRARAPTIHMKCSWQEHRARLSAAHQRCRWWWWWQCLICVPFVHHHPLTLYRSLLRFYAKCFLPFLKPFLFASCVLRCSLSTAHSFGCSCSARPVCSFLFFLNRSQW